jgi:hypothetical protein
MRRAFLYGAVVLSLVCSALNTSAQSMSHEEEVVRNAYARFSFLCGLPPVTNAGTAQLADTKIDAAKLEASVANATPLYELSDFQTGSIASIANEPWGSFVTAPLPPSQGGEVLGRRFGISVLLG